ncbi:MAG: hypothetical protein JSU81_10200 [Candidatus Coatesbacteria bacterium]|nr:MAG: hypothetical protein JSU81_10200 [Candidatus Coatesbacteria bacterium]
MQRRLFTVGCWVAAWAAAAGASMVQFSTADLVDHATLVVTGTVEAMRPLPPDAQGMIFTEVTVRVNDAVVGATAEDVITVRAWGGEYGDLGVAVEDQPTFALDEEVVLFLAPAEGGGYHCPDGVQSKYVVVEGTVLPVGVTLTEFLAEVTEAAGR